MGEYVYVDYSNLFIEAQRVSAVHNRQVGSIGEAMATKTIDYDYRIDFDQLYHFLAGVRPKLVQRIALFGSMSPETNWVWAMACVFRDHPAPRTDNIRHPIPILSGT